MSFTLRAYAVSKPRVTRRCSRCNDSLPAECIAIVGKAYSEEPLQTLHICYYCAAEEVRKGWDDGGHIERVLIGLGFEPKDERVLTKYEKEPDRYESAVNADCASVAEEKK